MGGAIFLVPVSWARGCREHVTLGKLYSTGTIFLLGVSTGLFNAHPASSMVPCLSDPLLWKSVSPFSAFFPDGGLFLLVYESKSHRFFLPRPLTMQRSNADLLGIICHSSTNYLYEVQLPMRVAFIQAFCCPRLCCLLHVCSQTDSL